MQATLFEPISTYTPSEPLSVFCGEVQAVYKRIGRRARVMPKKVDSSLVCAEFFRSIWPNDLTLRERMFAAFTDRSNMIIGYSEISAGGVSATICDPKLLFQKALLSNASGIILAHCHPSGKKEFSEQDKNITQQIKDGSKLLDFVLLDHIVLTENSYASFSEQGLL